MLVSRFASAFTVLMVALMILARGTAQTPTPVRAQSLDECLAPGQPKEDDPGSPSLEVPNVVDPAIGGTVADPSGKVTVTFEPGDTDESLRIEVEASQPCEQRVGQLYLLEQVSLNAYAVDRGGAKVTSFDSPVRLHLNLDRERLMPFVPDSLKLLWLNESSGEWEQVPADVDFARGTIDAEVAHFSDFAGSAVPGVILPPTLSYGHVDMQSGAAAAGIPIEVPAGPGGLKPELGFTYSSAVVDEMKDAKSMASWVGAGWNLSVPSITRDPIIGRYYLGMAGVSDLLIRENNPSSSNCPNGITGQTCYRWYTKRDQFLDIRSVLCGTNGTPDVFHQFFVRTKDGTEYQFGTLPGGGLCPTGDPDNGASFPTSLQYFNSWWDDPAGWHRYHYRMGVSRITDANGNTIDFKYFQDEQSNCPLGANPSCQNYVRAAYPLEIHYGKNGDNHRFKVEFTLVSDWTSYGGVRRDAPFDSAGTCSNYAPLVVESRFLDKVTVSKEDGTRIREYDLSFTNATSTSYSGSCPVSGNLQLDSIAEYGLGTTDLLRTHDFDYQNHGKRYRQNDAPPYTDCASSISGALDRPYLEEAFNGLGASVEFDYYTSPAKWASSGGSPACGWERLIAESRTVHPGGAQPNQVYEYTYGTMVYWAAPGAGLEHLNAEFRGFLSATEANSVSVGGTVLGKLVCSYDNTSSYLAGLVTSCSTQTNGSAVLTSVSNTWALVDRCTTNCNLWEGSTINAEFEAAKFIRLDRVTDLETGRNTNTTDYQYSTTPTGYGNVNKICEYDGAFSSAVCGSDAMRHRVTSLDYMPANTTKYIVSAVERRDVENNAGSQQAQTKYFYDGASDQSTAPNRPLVTRIDQDKTTSSEITTSQYVFNAYGNMTSQTDGRGNTTSYTPTGCDNTMVVQIVAGGLTTYHSYTESTDDRGCLFQKPEKITAPNGGTTNTRYDAFGRPDKTWLSGDSEASPTYDYDYDWNDGGVRNGSLTYAKDATGTMWSASWTDGLGRVIQSRREAVGGSIVTDRGYDAAGNIALDSLPYGVASGVDYTTADYDYSTTYLYDAAGRQTRLNHSDTADGYRETVYSGSTRTQYDEPISGASNKVVHTQDAFGRTTEVTDYEGSTSRWSIAYAYNQLDLVTSIEYDSASSGSEITYTYDQIGRRTGVTDDDRGTWSWAYCNDGLLRRQTDARNISITFAYDALGRVTAEKQNYSNDDCSSALTSPTIAYTYDSAPTGGLPTSESEGHLTQVDDEVGQHLFSYDLRGRKIYERLVVSGAPGAVNGNYNLQYSYDSLDRIDTLTYPDGEVVDHNYDTQGNLIEVDSTYSTRDYLQSATYDSADQPLTQVLGLVDQATATRTVTRAYNAPDLSLQSIAVSSNLLSLGYEWDARGRVSKQTDSWQGDTIYGYDYRGRLLSASGGNTESMTYDTHGRMLTKVSAEDMIADVSPMCYNYNSPCDSTEATNRITSAGVNDPSLVYDRNYTPEFSYDADGNVLSVSADDPEMQLMTLYQYSASGEKYDARGRLKWISYDKQDALSFDLVDTNCVINISDVLALKVPFNKELGQVGYDAKFDIVPSAKINITDVLAFKPLFNSKCMSFWYDYAGRLGRIGGSLPGLGGVYIGDLYEKHTDGTVRKYYYAGGSRIAMRDTKADGTTTVAFRYFAQDHLGSTVLEMDGDGAPTSRVFYNPYGEIIATDYGSPHTTRLFTGHLRLGAKTGFYYAGARFYSARYGRFLSPDPVNPIVGDSRTINAYAYAANNPMTYTDPTGMMWMSDGGQSSLPLMSGYNFAQVYYSTLCGYYGACGSDAAAGLAIIFIGGLNIGGGAVPEAMMSVNPAAYSAVSKFRWANEETPWDVVARVAEEQRSKDVDDLLQVLSRDEQAAYWKNPANGSRFLGKAVHTATKDALDDVYPGRFEYNARGPDFYDIWTGVRIELTTPGQVASHARRPGYENARIVTYTGFGGSFSP